MKGFAHGECSKRTRMRHEKRARWSTPAIEFDREVSSGHFVRMYKFSHMVSYTTWNLIWILSLRLVEDMRDMDRILVLLAGVSSTNNIV